MDIIPDNLLFFYGRLVVFGKRYKHISGARWLAWGNISCAFLNAIAPIKNTSLLTTQKYFSHTLLLPHSNRSALVIIRLSPNPTCENRSFLLNLHTMLQHDCDNNDRILWNRFKEGSIPAYSQIMKSYYQPLYNYGSRFTKDQELLKDNIQELFILIWNSRQSLNDTLSIKNYLFKSLRRRLFKAQNKATPTIQIDETQFDAGFNSILPADTKIILQESLKEISHKIREVLQQLSPRQQEVIYLRFYMDADIDDIAAIMNLSRQSVYNLLHESFKRFKTIADFEYFNLSLSLLYLLLLEILKN